ncbi:maltokinase N-terminal cap-like domain-containing protein [Streptacidiphilus carbonis]|uniref:maltokinase N-terminal cap-like domain-containing protein n=1 Tax=Streptacidiphilus carbonis TaxID=105422 RepID=UPI0005A78981|nr:hypothetical protein [Streptacidiphilus carbonis]
MSVIHRTTLEPTKLELLTEWLPRQPWFAGGGKPELEKAGGFRLDDPRGEVGIEFMVVRDSSGGGSDAYLVPLSYRGAPLPGAEQALVGTTEHGVLGRRWVYDGTHDPVLVAQLYALLAGAVEAQAQSLTDTPDPTVRASLAEEVRTASAELLTVRELPAASEIRVRTGADGAELTLGVNRRLRTGAGIPPVLGEVGADWRQADGATVHGCFVEVRR